MPSSERDRLAHMIEAANDAVQFASGRARLELDDDRMLRRALIQCIEVIGEASVHLSPQTRAQLPEVPWRSIRGMRNFLAHAYFNVDLDVLWKTVTQDVPQLAPALHNALDRLDGSRQ